MLSYHKNNLLFRIASAGAISRFKSTQAASFIQLARRELDWDDGPKEVVLLEFDHFSYLILSLESNFIAANGTVFSHQLNQEVGASLNRTFSEIELVMIENPEIFSEDARQFTAIIHEYARDAVAAQLNSIEGTSINRAYEMVVSALGSYLQHLLACMHEFNNNAVKKSSTEFLSCSEFCQSINKHGGGMLPLLQRARFFAKSTPNASFILKNYCDVDVLEQLQQFMGEHGINLVPEHSSQLAA